MPGRGARLTARGEQVGGVYLLPGAVARGGSTLVGNAFGAGRPAEARAVAGQVALLAVVVQALQIGALWLLRREVGGLFTPSASEVEDRLSEVDLDATTPVDALILLRELKNLL